MPTAHTQYPLPEEAEIQRRLNFADAALGAAGHEATDPEARALARRVAAGEITGDEVVTLTLELFREHDIDET